MQESTEQMMNAVVAAIRAQVLQEMQQRPTATPTRRLLTCAQAAEYLGRTEPAVRQMVFKCQLVAVRIGRNVRIDVRDLDVLIAESRV